MKRPNDDNEEVSKRIAVDDGPRLVVGWFRNDLRLKDNPVFEAAVQRAHDLDVALLLVYILDPRFYDRSLYGRVTDPAYTKSIDTRLPVDFSSRKCNPRRASFYLSVLRDLQQGLSTLGTRLHILQGKPEDVFDSLSSEFGSSLEVFCLREPVSPEWTDVEDAVETVLKERNGSLSRLWGALSLYHEEDLPFHLGRSSGSYTGLAHSLGWVDVWTSSDREEWAAPIRRPTPRFEGLWIKSPTSAPSGAWPDELLDATKEATAVALARLGFESHEVTAFLDSPHTRFDSKEALGETAAWARFEAWMAQDPESEQAQFADWDLPTSGTQRTAETGEDRGSVDALQWKNLSRPNGWMQISKYLAVGCITPRAIFHALADRGHWALAGVVHRLMWREWHRFNAIKFHRRLYWLQGPGRQNQVWKKDPVVAERWKKGQTGVPYIDACMRELNETGWLAYKGRKTVAAFLSIDLWLDWRIGAFHFEEVLLDYDVAMNYGNWVTCVRVDKDYWGQSFRNATYDDLKLKLAAEATNDPDGSYIRRWVPELDRLPSKYLHVPWMLPSNDAAELFFELGRDYPRPLLAEAKLQFIPSELAASTQEENKGSDEGWWTQSRNEDDKN